MRLKTLRFIEQGKGGKISFLAQFTRLQKGIAIGVLIVAIILAGAYLAYARIYGNRARISLKQTPALTFEWKDTAADNNIVSGYMKMRIQKLFIDSGDDKVLVPVYHKIAGRLTDQVTEDSGTYDLSDQALLLKSYLKSGDRVKAMTLKNEVIRRFKKDDGLYLSITGDKLKDDMRNLSAVEDNILWLEAYLEYYALYGTKDDYKEVENLAGLLFDSEGLPVKEKLSVARFIDSLYLGLEKNSDRQIKDDPVVLEEGTGSVADIPNDDIPEKTTVNRDEVEGIKLSSINLKLIYDLEHNNLIAKGAYDKALSVVKGGFLGNDSPFYAYACERTEQGFNYIYMGAVASSVDVTESVKTMANLASMGELDNSSYTQFKNLVINQGMIYNTYYMTTGNYGRGEAYDSYPVAMRLAILMNDIDLYKALCRIEGARVATKSTSPALYLIFRQEDDRYVFYSGENIASFLSVN